MELMHYDDQYSKAIDALNKSTDKEIFETVIPLPYKDKIFKWEEFARLQPQLDLEVNHYFSYGVYARELLIPADTILTGEIHKFENLNILVKGSIRVSIGDKIETIHAPFIVVSPPGTKRIAHTITDCIWITIHGTHERNIDKIKEMFIADSEKDWLEFSNADQLSLEFG